MAINLVMAGVIGGLILTCRLMIATGYLVEAMTADIVKMANSDAGNDRAR